MYAQVAWVLVSSGTQVQPQIILDQCYLPDNLSVSYDYADKHLQHLLSRHDECKKQVLITRDFNINLLGFQNNKKVQSFDVSKASCFAAE